jgi:hypothetical protein
VKKKNILFSIIFLLLVGGFITTKYFNTSQQQKSIQLTRWNKTVDEIKSKEKQKAKRSIASINNPDNKKNLSIIAHEKFKNQIKQQYKMGKDESFQYKSLAPGRRADFKNSTSSYKFLDHFYAIKDSPENRKNYPEHQEKLSYLIVKSQTPVLESLPVVENENTGHLGVFTGILKVKLKDINDSDFIIGHNNYQVVKRYEHIHIAHYHIEDVALAISTHQTLLQNPKVLRATLEILEYSRYQR